MPKQIATASHQLHVAERQNEELMKRISELVTENQCLKAYIGRHGLPVPQYHGFQPTTPTTPSNPQVGSERGFLQPTKASSYRSTQCTEPLSVAECNGHSQPTTIKYQSNQHSRLTTMQYVDGALVVRTARGGYREPTLSSANKCRPALRSRLVGGGWGDFPQSEVSASPSLSDFSSSTSSQQEPQEHHAEVQVVDDSLAGRSGLNERFSARLSTAPIESQVKCDLLKSSLRLAQEIFYKGAKKYIPSLAEVYSGPHEIVFGCEDMDSKLLPYVPYEIENIAGRQNVLRSTLQQAALEVTGLRNRVCHFNQFDGVMELAPCDELIRKAQALAVFFGDEEAAFEAKSYRSRLITYAEESVKEIGNLHALSQLPGARPWEKYQMVAFQKAMEFEDYYRALDAEVAIDPVILCAARNWDAERPWLGDETWKAEDLEKIFSSA
ncbi:hypothetical protein GGS26DRAFT_387494 [Hypomontagnella submonticulosa]|nr:hypothetical protein GGS26DRAFT_387494 [Hypomontagnella submonticulosa]